MIETRRYLLGKDTKEGLVKSVQGREAMGNQSDLTLFPMPNIRSKAGSIAEKHRLFLLEEQLRQAQEEVIGLRKKLDTQRQEFDHCVEQGYAEAYQIIQQQQKVIETQPKPKQTRPRPTHTPRVGFDHPETWWQWTKRVILRMS